MQGWVGSALEILGLQALAQQARRDGAGALERLARARVGDMIAARLGLDGDSVLGGAAALPRMSRYLMQSAIVHEVVPSPGLR
jgi:hypothetical protein